MKTTDQLASGVNRACVDATEAAILSPRMGEEFDAVVVDRGDKGATIQLLDPAVVASADGPGDAGAEVRARLAMAEVATSTVRFTLG